MKIPDPLAVLLNHALNEARLLDLQLRGPDVLIQIRALTFPLEGVPAAAQFTLCLSNFGRIAASLRRGNGDDDLAPTLLLRDDQD